MSFGDSLGVAVVILAIAGGAIWYQQQPAAPQTFILKSHETLTGSEGTYNIINVDGAGTFLINTKSGETWRKIVYRDDNGAFVTTYWSLMDKFDNFYDEIKYIEMYKDNQIPPTEEELQPEH